MRLSGKSVALCVMVIVATSAWSQTSWTWPGCPNVTDADFKYDTLVIKKTNADTAILSEPDKIAFDMDASGNTDVYWVEIRPGKIKRYNAATKTIKLLTQLPNWGRGTGNNDYLTVKNSTSVEEGVTGIALDPNFKTNRWVYIHWSPLPATNEVFRVSRFTITTGANGDTILPSSEKVILEIPGQRQTCCHTGGAMEFDAYGDLWITQGNNGGRAGSNTTNPPEGMDETKKYESDQWGASSTKGLRGNILRIHPDNSTKGYSIPSGNFGEYFAQQTGKSKYLDTSKVAPEIYIKGNRNPYSLALDPVRRWVAWGDVGPDVLTGAVREEVNLRQTPGFEGWPYFVGNNTTFSGGKIAATPINTSVFNTGLDTLPAARPAFFLPGGSSPITGPIYRYNGDLNSSVKFPPHFTRKWFTTDHDGNQIMVRTLDSLGTAVTASQRIFANHTFYGAVYFKAGPDGALYIVEYGSTNFSSPNGIRIEKISYTGSCRPSEPKLEQPNNTPILNPNARYGARASGWVINLRSGSPVTVPEGMKGFQLFDLMGRKMWEIKSLKPGDVFKLPELEQGAFKYRWIQALP